MQDKINCPVCQSSKVKDIIFLPNYPISNLALSSSKEEALKFKTYDMNIVMCEKCTHIYNNTPINLEYKQTNATYFTTEVQKNYINLLINDLVKRFDIKNKNIIEIGCGDALFLKEIAKYNKMCKGYEPSYQEKYKEQNIEIINDYFDVKKDLISNVDYIVIRHVLEHFENPNKFLTDIVDSISKINLEVKFIFEVPNIKPTLDSFRVNDFIHEHISHFSKYSFQYMLTILNLKVVDLYTTDNEENIVCVCELNKEYFKQLNEVVQIGNGFKRSIKNTQNDYKRLLENNNVIAIWGAEGRGGGFIKMIKDLLRGDEFIIDSDEKKFNKYLPSIGLKISSYKELIDQSLDAIIITTAIGKENILKEIKDNKIKVENIYMLSQTGLSRIEI